MSLQINHNKQFAQALGMKVVRLMGSKRYQTIWQHDQTIQLNTQFRVSVPQVSAGTADLKTYFTRFPKAKIDTALWGNADYSHFPSTNAMLQRVEYRVNGDLACVVDNYNVLSDILTKACVNKNYLESRPLNNGQAMVANILTSNPGFSEAFKANCLATSGCPSGEIYNLQIDNLLGLGQNSSMLYPSSVFGKLEIDYVFDPSNSVQYSVLNKTDSAKAGTPITFYNTYSGVDFVVPPVEYLADLAKQVQLGNPPKLAFQHIEYSTGLTGTGDISLNFNKSAVDYFLAVPKDSRANDTAYQSRKFYYDSGKTTLKDLYNDRVMYSIVLGDETIVPEQYVANALDCLTYMFNGHASNAYNMICTADDNQTYSRDAFAKGKHIIACDFTSLGESGYQNGSISGVSMVGKTLKLRLSGYDPALKWLYIIVSTKVLTLDEQLKPRVIDP